MRSIPPPSILVERRIWRGDTVASGERTIPEETPVALTYGRSTHAVMMATPTDLADFALGFSLSEGIVKTAADIEALEIVAIDGGIELRMDLSPEHQTRFSGRQRRIVGPGGCGLCGMDSLAEAIRPPPIVRSDMTFSAADIQTAMASMPPAQQLNVLTRAVHGAGFWTRERGLVVLREDVGRHNALDKLVGAVASAGHQAAEGLVLLSSRVSVEMVQKAAVLGAPVIVAVSAPTGLALRTAAAADITLIGVARTDAFEVFTHPNRITTGSVRHVA
jgi:FdhD protein